mmetsp:Transcript_52412/g.170122  ORF Transcript_52412/g.170122 Transcript_52412/m.170122 type:complete len:301 (-) Transcript_52412:156-1058(-)
MTGRAVVRGKGKRLGTREDVRQPQFRNRHGLRAAVSQQLENLLEIRIGSEELLTREQVVGLPQVSPAQHAREVGSARRGNRTPQKLLKLEVLRRLAKVFRKSRPVDRLLEVHIWAQCCECPHVVRSVDGSNSSTINRLESVEQSPQVALGAALATLDVLCPGRSPQEGRRRAGCERRRLARGPRGGRGGARRRCPPGIAVLGLLCGGAVDVRRWWRTRARHSTEPVAGGSHRRTGSPERRRPHRPPRRRGASRRCRSGRAAAEGAGRSGLRGHWLRSTPLQAWGRARGRRFSATSFGLAH